MAKATKKQWVKVTAKPKGGFWRAKIQWPSDWPRYEAVDEATLEVLKAERMLVVEEVEGPPAPPKPAPESEPEVAPKETEEAKTDSRMPPDTSDKQESEKVTHGTGHRQVKRGKAGTKRGKR